MATMRFHTIAQEEYVCSAFQPWTARPQPERIFPLADGRLVGKLGEEVILKDGIAIPDITRLDFQVFIQYAKQPDVVIPDSTACEQIWGYDDAYVRDNLRTRICYLRSKMGKEDLGSPHYGVFRRFQGTGYIALSTLTDSEENFEFANGRISVNPLARRVEVDGKVLDTLTTKEYEILAYLGERAGSAVNITELGEALWQRNDERLDCCVRVATHFTRKKLGQELGHPKTGAIATLSSPHGYMARLSLEA